MITPLEGLGRGTSRNLSANEVEGTVSGALEKVRGRATAAWNLGRAIVCNRAGLLTRPSLAHLYVTWRCNLRCQSCNVWRKDIYPELPTDEMLKVIKQLRFLDVVKLTGGEPFLRDDLEVLVEAVDRHIQPAMLHIVSNGSLSDRTAQLAERLGNPRMHFRISLEGGNVSHNRLRGRTWAFERAWRTLERLVALRKGRGFHVGVNFHLCEETLPELSAIADYCRSHRVDLVPGFNSYPFLEDRYENVWLEHDATTRAHLVERFQEIWSMRAGMTPWEALLARRQGVRAASEMSLGCEATRFSCRELRNLMYVLPNGNLVTCGLKHRPIGNLAMERFDDLWFGTRIEPFRREVDACPGCWQTSIRMASRLYSGDLKKSPAISS